MAEYKFKKAIIDEATTWLIDERGDTVAIITQESRKEWTAHFKATGERIAGDGGKRSAIIYAQKKLCEIKNGKAGVA